MTLQVSTGSYQVSAKAVGAAQYNPIDYPDLYDYIYVNGQECPGWCVVSGWVRKWGWEKKTGKGIQGTVLTFTGKPSAEGDIIFYLTEPADFEEWVTFFLNFKYDATKKKQLFAVDVRHPLLVDIGVRACVVETISQIEHEGLNLWSRKVHLVEYAPPPKAASVSTPQGSTNKSDVNTFIGPPAPDPTNPLDTKIASMAVELGQP
jgi:hypothetical protein